MKPIRSASGLRRALEKAKSGVADDTILSVKAVIYIAELLEKMAKTWTRDYTLFVAYHTRIEGRTLKETAKLWQERKLAEVEKDE